MRSQLGHVNQGTEPATKGKVVSQAPRSSKKRQVSKFYEYNVDAASFSGKVLLSGMGMGSVLTPDGPAELPTGISTYL